jgi:hypothetical protein
MKLAMNLILVVGLIAANIAFAPPAHAGLGRKILGAPFFAVGFVVTLIGDLVATPFKSGSQQYIYGAPVKGW